MLKAAWHICFFASVFALVFAFGFFNTNSLSAVRGEFDLNRFDTSQSPSYKPLKLGGEWLFTNENLLEKPLPRPEHFSAGASHPDSLVSTALAAITGGVATESVSFPSKPYSTFNPLDGSTPVSGTYITTIRGLANYFESAPLGLTLDSACGVTKAHFFNPTSPGPAKSIAVTSGTTILPEMSSDGVLLLQVSGPTAAGQCQAPILGTVSQLLNYESKQVVRDALLIAALFTITLYAIGMYVYFHREPANFWLGTWAALAAVYFWNTTGFWHLSISNVVLTDDAFITKLQLLTLVFLGPLAFIYYRYLLLDDRLPRAVIPINLALTSILALMVFLSPIQWLSQNSVILVSFVALQIVGITGLVTRRFSSLNAKEKVITIGCGLSFFIALSHDLYFNQWLADTATLSQYALMILLLGNCIIQSHRVSDSYDLSSRMSKSLAAEVNRQTETLEVKNRLLLKVQTQLEKSNRELKTLSITDSLTGTHNRLYFDRQFQVEWQRCRREQKSFSLLLADIDHFKGVNDEHGHMVGDYCLKNFAAWVESFFKRSNDIVCRYGGEEFAVLLPDTAPAQALKFAEKLRKTVESTPIVHSDKEIRLTVSVGVCGTIPQAHTQAGELFRAADRALYYVKHNGRNGVKLENLAATGDITTDFVR